MFEFKPVTHCNRSSKNAALRVKTRIEVFKHFLVDDTLVDTEVAISACDKGEKWEMALEMFSNFRRCWLAC